MTLLSTEEKIMKRVNDFLVQQNERFETILKNTKDEMQKISCEKDQEMQRQIGQLKENVLTLKEKKQKQCDAIQEFCILKQSSMPINRQEHLALVFLHTCKEVISGNSEAILKAVKKLCPESENINESLQQEITTLASTLADQD